RSGGRRVRGGRMIRWLWVPLGFLVATLLIVALAGPRGSTGDQPPRQIFPDMFAQPRYNAQSRSNFFADQRTMRAPVAGTVPYGGADYFSDAGSPTPRADMLREDAALYRGTAPGSGWLVDDFVRTMPVKFDRELLDRGKAKFNTFCAVCHGASGAGNGI